MASLSAVISHACQGSQGIITLESAGDAPGAPADGAYTWLVVHQVTNVDYGGAVEVGGSVSVPDGTFSVRVFASYGNGSTAASTPKTVAISCGSSTAPLTLDSLSGHAPTTAGGTGSVEVLASGGTAPLTATVGTGSPQPLTAGQLLTVAGVVPSTYQVRVADASGQQVSGTVTVDAYRLAGCTDPAATNYDPGATADNGSCTYAPPPALLPFFAVPLLQTLRFVVRQGGAATGFDEALFCEQVRPGQQVRPFFYQPVQRESDEVRVQVLTSYAAVTAMVLHHGGGAAGPPVALQQVLTLEGSAAPLTVVLSEDAGTGLTRLQAAAGGLLPASLLGAARLTLAGAAAGTYRVTRAVPGSVLNLADYVVLSRPWAAPGAGAVTASWRLSGPGFNVWEANLPLGALADGYYFVRLTATAAGWADAVAESEPWHLRDYHAATVALDYRNADNCFAMVFSTGITPRLRVPGTFFRQKNGGTSSTYRNSAGEVGVLSSTAQRLIQLETYGLPAWLHEKIYLACRLDYLAVNNVRCQTDQAYEVSDNRTYPLSAGRIFLEQTPWLGSGNGDDAGLGAAPDNALALREGGYLLLRGEQ